MTSIKDITVSGKSKSLPVIQLSLFEMLLMAMPRRRIATEFLLVPNLFDY